MKSEVKIVPADTRELTKGAPEATRENFSGGALLLRKCFAVFELDVRSLAAFRIAFGLVLLADLLIRAEDLRFFYTDQGVLPTWGYTLASGPWDISLYLANGSWQWAASLWALSLLVCSSFIVGYRTRESTILLAVLMLSIQRRNGLVLQGADGVMRAMLFWSMFLPLGRCWSVDARTEGQANVSRPFLGIASVCVIAQMMMIYVFAGLMKTHRTWQIDGTALQYALNIDYLTNANGRFLLQFPDLLRALSFSVVALERFVVLFLLLPFYRQTTRMVLVSLFLAFHLGIALTMVLGPFPYVCMACWLVLLPPRFWDAFSLKKRPPQLSVVTAKGEKTQPQAETTSARAWRAVQGALLLFFLLVTVQWNRRLLDLEHWEKVYPVKYDFILTLVGLDQNWGMFTPFPFNWDGWFLISGKTLSGRTVNLTPGAKPEDAISEERPADIWRMYKNERQRKYMMSLANDSSVSLRPYYVRALALDWARKHPGEDLVELDIVFFQELTQADGSSTPPQKVPIWHSTNPSLGI